MALLCQNLSSSPITVTFDLPKTMNTQLLGTPAPIQLQPQQKVPQQFVLNFKSLSIPQKLKGTITYNPGISLPFFLNLPCSLFILPQKISFEEFCNLVKNVGTLVLSNCSVDFIQGYNSKQMMQKVASILNIELIQLHGEDGIFYGKSVQNHHTFVMVKTKGKQLQVEIKCVDGALASNLALELDQRMKELN